MLGLDEDKTSRIVFHEILKPAILEAIQSPRRLDMNLVNAQQARRVLDRLVGFKALARAMAQGQAGPLGRARAERGRATHR